MGMAVCGHGTYRPGKGQMSSRGGLRVSCSIPELGKIAIDSQSRDTGAR